MEMPFVIEFNVDVLTAIRVTGATRNGESLAEKVRSGETEIDRTPMRFRLAVHSDDTAFGATEVAVFWRGKNVVEDDVWVDCSHTMPWSAVITTEAIIGMALAKLVQRRDHDARTSDDAPIFDLGTL